MSVDLVAWRVFGWAFQLVPPGNVSRVHVFQAELADVEDAVSAVLLGIRRRIPRVDLESAKLYAFDLAGRTRRLLGLLDGHFELSLHVEHALPPFLLGPLLGLVESPLSSLAGRVLDVSASASLRMPPYGLPFSSSVSLSKKE